MRPDLILLAAPPHLIEDTVRFYRELLAREPDAPGGRRFTIIGRDLAIVPGGADRMRRETGLAFHVHGLSRLLARLQDEGFLHVAQGGDAACGDGLSIEDPAGNVIKLIDDGG